MKTEAHAKINLILDVAGRRPDGYHELRTVFYEIKMHDVIYFEASETPGINIKCTDSLIPCGEDNLVYKAADMLFKKYGIKSGINVFIEKNIPYGAGLGGGSSDAAAAIKALNTLYKLEISDEEMRRYAACIGADVPFFISGGTAYAEGIGEKLSKIKNIDTGLVITAKPPFEVPTGGAYKALDAEESLFHPDVNGFISAFKSKNKKEIYKYIGNSFEIPVFKMYDDIRKLKEAFLEEGACASAMSGSGSAVFALYEDEVKAQRAACSIKRRFENIRVYLDNGELLK